MSNPATWAHVVRTSREWLRRGNPTLRGIRDHMRAHKTYLDSLRMEAR